MLSPLHGAVDLNEPKTVIMASDNSGALHQLAAAAAEVERASGDIPASEQDASSAEISPLLLMQQLADLRTSLQESQACEAQRHSVVEHLMQLVTAQAQNNVPDQSSTHRPAQRDVRSVKPPAGEYDMSSVEYRTFRRDWLDYQRLTRTHQPSRRCGWLVTCD